MLIQPSCSPSGRATAEAAGRPVASLRRSARPSRIISCQSADVWFQPASALSAMAAGMSASSRRPSVSVSVAAISIFELRGLVEAWHIPCYPVCSPIQHLGDRDLRVAEETEGFGRVVEPGRFSSFADQLEVASHTPCKFAGKPGYGQNLRPGHIQGCSWNRGVGQSAQCIARGITLPDHVHMPGGNVDRLAGPDRTGEIVQHTVTQVDGVVEAKEPAGRSVLL